jgi:hypothetical protein
MPRTKRLFDFMMGRFPEGTFARMDAVRGATEDRTDFLRAAVERELRRREQRAEHPRAGRDRARG